MNRKLPIVLACSLVALAFSASLVRAQGGPPPGPGGPPPFGGGRDGFRVVGVEGCLTNGRPVPSGTPGYAASILHERMEASFSGTPTKHSSTELFYRDNSGVTYTQLTLPAIGGSQTRTVICINDPNLHIRLVVNPADSTAREFNLPDHNPPTGGPGAGGQPPQNGSNNPEPRTPPPGVTVTNPPAPDAVKSEIATFCPDAQTTQITRTTPEGTATNEHVFCPSLRTELYSQNSDSHGVSTTTTTITATGTGVNLAGLAVPYPLTPNYAVTVVTPGKGGRGFRGRGGSGGPVGPGGPQ